MTASLLSLACPHPERSPHESGQPAHGDVVDKTDIIQRQPVPCAEQNVGYSLVILVVSEHLLFLTGITDFHH